MDLLSFLVRSNIKSTGKKLFVLSHQGLGDQLTLYGYITEMKKEYPVIVYVIKENLLETVKMMYHDYNLIYYIIKDDSDISPNYNFKDKDTLLKILQQLGFRSHFHYTHSLEPINDYIKTFFTFTEIFYLQFKLNPELRYTFNVKRNLNREKELYNKVVSDLGQDYIVIHEDTRRNFIINRDFVSDLPIFYVGEDSKYKSDNIFDYITILEKAKEIHVFDSFLSIFVDQLKLKNKVYFHTYLRYGDTRLYQSKFIYLY
jgi:hypothetical protein